MPPSASAACSRRSTSSKKLFASGLSGKDVRHEGGTASSSPRGCGPCPRPRPPILVAASGPVTTRRAGRTVDGLITEATAPDKLGMLLQRFGEGAREAGRDPDAMPKVLRLHLSWAATDEEAMTNALTQWPNLGMRFPKADIRSPYELEQLARLLTPAGFEGRMLVSADRTRTGVASRSSPISDSTTSTCVTPGTTSASSSRSSGATFCRRWCR
ncbi:MAG: LLM class flavin-dependent oxidoreductase [Schumannella sp.]